MKKNLPELLAPAGSPEALEAAIAAGADAVYFGGAAFNARMNAHNFDGDVLRDAFLRCQSCGVKTNVTVNTLVHDREISDLLKTVERFYRLGADALIVADLGAAALIHRYFPDMVLHASTQTAGHNRYAAEELRKIGFSRMVAARELSYEDFKLLCRTSPIETELFVHGAICVCQSGQCLASSLIGGRSGNRGECAQPCRLPYRTEAANPRNGKNAGKESYALSLKDMCLADHIPELISLGAASLKIEGRMKAPEYVYGVTSVYRRLLDENRPATADETAALRALFSRSGFTDGYFVKHIDKNMLGVRTDADKESTKNFVRAGKIEQQSVSADRPKGMSMEKSVVGGKPKSMSVSDRKSASMPEWNPVSVSDRKTASVPEWNPVSVSDRKTASVPEWNPVSASDRQAVSVPEPKAVSLSRNDSYTRLADRRAAENRPSVSLYAEIRADKPIRLTLRLNGIEATAEGPIPTLAQNRPLTRETVLDKLTRFGDTAYQVGEATTVLDDNCMLPLSSLNHLRRDAIALLDEKRQSGDDGASRKRQFTLPAAVEAADRIFDIPKQKKTVTARFAFPEQMPDDLSDFDIVYLPLEVWKKTSRANGVILPPVILDTQTEEIRGMLNEAKENGIVHALVSNPGHLSLVREAGMIPHGDFRLNIYNRYTVGVLFSLGFADLIVSPELNRGQIHSLGLAAVTYGRIPLMVLEKCCIRDLYGCQECEKRKFLPLYDRKGVPFPLTRSYLHRNILYNSVPIYTADTPMPESVGQHFIFSNESAKEAESVICAYRQSLPPEGQVRRIK